MRDKKYPSEIESLKYQWTISPVWLIEETKGFEAHKEELKAYRLEKEGEWNKYATRRLLEKAQSLGISNNLALAEYILYLEDRIDSLYRQNGWKNV